MPSGASTRFSSLRSCAWISDEERTHGDVRELYRQWARGDVDITLGAKRVLWAVIESQHLVDVINQTDLVENLDGEDKLGQPMLQLTIVRSYGTFSFLGMPYFRERTFPGADGRFRPPLLVDEDLATYESGAEEWHVDGAARWTHFVGRLDFGLSHFHGTSRDPRLVVVAREGVAPALAPFYEVIDQTGFDGQLTSGGWLLKLEVITRTGRDETYVATAGGFEYTLVGLFDTVADVGLLAEHSWDGRGPRAPTPFQNDLFVGARIVLNDVQSTELLAGLLLDLEGGGAFGNLEASRRFGDRWRLELEARFFGGAGSNDPLSAFLRDDYVGVELKRFF